MITENKRKYYKLEINLLQCLMASVQRWKKMERTKFFQWKSRRMRALSLSLCISRKRWQRSDVVGENVAVCELVLFGFRWIMRVAHINENYNEFSGYAATALVIMMMMMIIIMTTSVPMLTASHGKANRHDEHSKYTNICWEIIFC